jgi:hypothetical protein
LQAAEQHIVGEDRGLLEDRAVRLKLDPGAAAVGGAEAGEVMDRDALGVPLAVVAAIAPDVLNLPPACNIVSATSAALLPTSGWMSVGMPRPLSSIETEPSSCRMTKTRSQWPAMASSIELSTTS